jgi:hypothetical protein
MKRINVVLIGASVLLSVPISAKDNHSPFMVLSEGASTCGEFVAEPEKQAMRMEWVLGYISGRNLEAPSAERFAGRSFQKPATVIGWLQTYCGSRAMQPLFQAGEDLRAEFLRQERQLDR